jgi:hypothetical protein
VLALAYWLVRRDWSWPNPWRFAVLAALLATVWLLLAATSTIGYLSPVVGDAVEAVFNTASGEAPPRALFEGRGSNLPTTPFPARAVALLAVALLAAALPFGLLRIWRRYRSQPFALLFAVTALAFFATLLLRLAPAAWETGNRAGEFLFIGLAFVVACAGLQDWRPWNRPRIGRLSLTAALGVVLVGGAIAGWPWDLQLAPPIRAKADGGTISSTPLAVAEWAGHNIPEEERFAAAAADARTLMVPGGRIAFAGKTPDIQDLLEETSLSDWELPLLRDEDVRYVVTDRREISSDVTRGYSFSIRGDEEELLPLASVTKFAEIPGAMRIYSSGDISVYDLGKQR